MDVRCPQCQTLYELDDGQTARGSVTLKCSRCQHVFRFEPKSAISQENQRRWMVNSTKDGAILYLTDFADLHRWIMEKKVRRNDTISRTGEKWVKIGTIPEFAPIFIVVDSISDLTGAPEDSHIATRVREGTPAEAPEVDENTAVETPSGRTETTADRERVKTNVQFPNAAAKSPPPKPQAPSPTGPNRAVQQGASQPARPKQPTPGELPPRPGGRPHTDTGERPVPRQTQPSRPQPAAEPDWSISDDQDTRVSDKYAAVEQPSGSRAPLVIVVLLLLVGGGAAAVYFTQPQLVEQLLGAAATGPEDVVTLGDDTTIDEPEAETTAVAEVDPGAAVGAAITAALDAQSARERELFDGAIFAIHQPLGTAIDMATSRASKAAEGGLVDEQLASARKALERGQVRKARDLFEQVLEFEPRNANAIAGLGFVYLEESNSDRAAVQFQKAIDAGGGDGSAYIGLGTAERQRGNTQAAYDAYDLYLGRYPRGEKASIARYQLQQLRKQLGM